MSILNESELNTDINKVISWFDNQLKSIHTGRPRADMLEDMPVYIKSYQQDMELKSLTSIEIIDGKFRLQPYDKSILNEIANAIRNSNLGLNPDVKDDVILISIPPLTQESRKARVKQVNEYLEGNTGSALVQLRDIRRDYLNDIKGLKEGVSEDDKKSAEKTLQKYIDDAQTKLEASAHKKETELMTV